MSEERHDLETLRARLDGTRGQQVLAQPRGAVGHARIQGLPASRVSAKRIRVARPRGPARLPEADVRVARAGRRQRVHPATHRGTGAVRPAAGRTGAREALVLRDGHAVCRFGHRPARREPRRPADQGRRQPGSSVQPRRHRRVRAGRDSRTLRSRSVADHHEPRRNPSVRRVLRRAARRGHRPAVEEGCGPAHPHRDRGVAHARRADAGHPDAAARSEVGAVGARRPSQRARRQPARLRRVRGHAVRDREGRRHSVARRGLHVHQRIGSAARARVRVAPSRREHGGPQPALRRREHADDQLDAGGSPSAAQGVPGGGLHAHRCRTGRRERRVGWHVAGSRHQVDCAARGGPAGRQRPQRRHRG